MTIINKGDILEYGLNNNYSFKLIENGTKIIIDKNNDITCDNNESYDIININNNSNSNNNETSNIKENEILDKLNLNDQRVIYNDIKNKKCKENNTKTNGGENLELNRPKNEV